MQCRIVKMKSLYKIYDMEHLLLVWFIFLLPLFFILVQEFCRKNIFNSVLFCSILRFGHMPFSKPIIYTILQSHDLFIEYKHSQLWRQR